ncbi:MULTISPECIES: hypothetical protein [Protofrankia]|uniref:hypothetical protein n=1 Tax=Protofrankia TaxID=2994361 RepID=UPI0011155740|nr:MULTISPECIES: hypothetical protein [Protofrankia]
MRSSILAVQADAALNLALAHALTSSLWPAAATASRQHDVAAVAGLYPDEIPRPRRVIGESDRLKT